MPCSQTVGIANTRVISLSDAGCSCSGSFCRVAGNANQVSMAAATIRPIRIRITWRSAAVRSARLAVSGSTGSKVANTATMMEAVTAESRPRPPSSKPKAVPCASSLPHSRVARISGAHNNAIVVTPQHAYSTTNSVSVGIVINNSPPDAVVNSAITLMLRAAKRSASGPPNRKAAIATAP